MEIKKFQIKYNYSKRNEAIKYIVIHDTGNRNKGANAIMHYNYFNGGDRQSSADIFVDDKNIIQINDYKTNYSWAVGDGKGKYGITNKNSVSIEMCINSDGNYEEMLKNTIDATIYLMKDLNIEINEVVKHNDASKKNCPQTMNNKGDWSKWNEFKQKIQDKIQDEINEQNKKLEEELKQQEELDFQWAIKRLNERKIINYPETWVNGAIVGKTIPGNFVGSLFANFANYIQIKNNLDDILNYIVKMEAIKTREYWENSIIRNEQIKGEYIRILIKNLSNIIK